MSKSQRKECSGSKNLSRTEDVNKQSELRKSYINKWFPIHHIDDLSHLQILLPDLRATFSDANNKIQKVSLGEESYFSSEKGILMFGETGTGKSTLVNAIVNYIFGVEREDDIRLQLVDEGSNEANQTESQTKWITAYTIHHQSWFKVPFTLTVIDTPGILNTSGVIKDDEVMNQLDNFFRTKGFGGMDVLDAVGFTVRAPDARLTDSQKYVFNRLYRLFARNMASLVFVLFTFADKRIPQALTAIREGNIACKNFFKFNNSALYSSNDNTNESIEVLWWRMGKTNLREFVDEVSMTEPQSLILTKELIEERVKLKKITEGIWQNSSELLNTLELLSLEMQQIHNHEDDIENFEYRCLISETCEITDENEYTTRCELCDIDCHRHCSISDIESKEKCSVMIHGYCGVCPGRCSWQNHTSVPRQYKTTKVKKPRQVTEEYSNRSVLDIKTSIIGHYEKKQKLVIQLVENAIHCLQRIDKIGMLPIRVKDPISLIDLMIHEEVCQDRLGYEKRILQLQNIRELFTSKGGFFQRFIPRHLYELCSNKC